MQCWSFERDLTGTAVQSTVTAYANTKNGQCNFIYPHSVISVLYVKWITCVFILDGVFSSLPSLEAPLNVYNTKCACLKRSLNR